MEDPGARTRSRAGRGVDGGFEEGGCWVTRRRLRPTSWRQTGAKLPQTDHQIQWMTVVHTIVPPLHRTCP
jgi:hypothetical protein